MGEGGEGRPAVPKFQQFKAGLPGGDVKANLLVPLHQRTEPEQQYLRELVQGFFTKLTRWQNILADEQFLQPKQEGWGEGRAFDVIATPQSSRIVPTRDIGILGKLKNQPDLILRFASQIQNDENDVPKDEAFSKTFSITPGQAGRQELVDINGEPLKNVDIKVARVTASENSFSQWLGVMSEIDSVGYDPNLGDYNRLQVEYDDNRKRVTRMSATIIRGYEEMTDAYASHLFETIDKQIPNALVTAPGANEEDKS